MTCLRCLDDWAHLFHDNGEPAGELPQEAQPPVQQTRRQKLEATSIFDVDWTWQQSSDACSDACDCKSQPKGDPRFHALLQQIGALHDAKQQDYGTNADAFANVRSSEEWGVSPWVGAMIRATDKVRRLQTYAAKGSLVNEGVEDSLMDLAVYSLIALILFREEQT
jgi:hypothetical protein